VPVAASMAFETTRKLLINFSVPEARDNGTGICFTHLTPSAARCLAALASLTSPVLAVAAGQLRLLFLDKLR
jgi:hypothetical protein